MEKPYMQWFTQARFGMFIHWGIYAIPARGEWIKQNESIPEASYQSYFDTFNPVHYDPRVWAKAAKEAGMKYGVMTSKHHDGFCLFDSKYTDYKATNTPARRDLVKEYVEAFRREGLQVGFYYSLLDWHHPDYPVAGDRIHPYRNHPDYQDHTGNLPRYADYVRNQVEELLTNYGKIDMLCLDMWLGKDIWPENRETVKLLRKLQPEVMLRIRGIGNYGDYYTPEGFVPGAPGNTDMPWMVIYPLGRFFSYDPDGSQYKGGAWLIRSLVDTVAKGGNFMAGIGPDGEGKFHPQAVRDLEQAGEWLKVNGEGIFATRPRQPWQEGEAIRFTRAKQGGCLYAFAMQWPGRSLRLESVRLPQEARVTMLGVPEPLAWRSDARGLEIDIPEVLQEEKNRPCKTAWAFKIEGILE